jgi:type I restriction-modification system DNA methylase subunit
MISNADTRNWFTVESGRFVEESFTVPPSAHSAADLKPLLEECGYTGTRLKEGYAFDSMTVPLVGFATKPWDFDSACIAVMMGNGDSEKTAHSCRGMGAPIVWVQHNGTVDWWMQHAAQPTLFARRPVQEFRALVQQHKDKLDPVSVYRGKTIARIDKSRQLDFVDKGFLPLLREEAGKKLHDLVEEMTAAMLKVLGGGEPSKEKLRKVFTAVFRLLGGKILKDKGVRGFKGLDLTKPVDVLSAVEKHYSAGQAAISITDEWKTALISAVSSFSSAGNFGVVSPETLAYVYEHTLVTKALRQKLGIHAPPPWLVDYMVWQLYDWIREIPENDRHVFEPACGHAPFLLSAMRLLRLEMQDRDEVEVHNYLKSHIHGIEIDDFAREIARLSLTLADIPNPNGWDLHDGDMYASDVLMREAAECRILLSNPPYEAFGDQAKRLYARNGQPVTANTKAAEMLQRTLPYLPPGGVFGVVVPQGVLHDKESRPIRERLLADFELSEISVFADNLFEHGDHEVAVLMGRRKKPRTKPVVLRYRRVREQGMEAFKARLAFTSEREVLPSRFTSNADATNLLLPDLVEVWDCLRELPTLGTVADIQQGFQFLNEDTLKGREVISKTRRAGWVRAILRAADDYTIWNLPKSVWIDNSPEVFRRPGAATQLGVPQVVLNYAPVAREPWRLKAVIDDEGLAVSSRFLVFREKVGGPSLPVLWALLNCPLANAYAYCFSGKRETLVKEWRAFPLPRLTPERKQAIEAAASAYLGAVETSESAFMQADAKNKVKQALLALDAEVLKLYDLPPRLERQLLDLFTGVERKGVGCDFRGYYPPGFTSYLPLHMVISDRFQRAAADATADRFKPGESAYMRDVLGAAAAGAGEE